MGLEPTTSSLGSVRELRKSHRLSDRVVENKQLGRSRKTSSSDSSDRSRPKQAHCGTRPAQVRKVGQHQALTEAAEAVRRAPKNEVKRQALASTLLHILEADAVPRARGRRVYVGKRAAALLNTYCHALPRSVKNQLSGDLAPQFREMEQRANSVPQSTHVTELQASVRLGITRQELLALCRDPVVRRSLGWPMPLSENRVLFAVAALDPRTANEYLAAMPAEEPWKRLPKGWLR
jgi:hypothetical protein